MCDWAIAAISNDSQNQVGSLISQRSSRLNRSLNVVEFHMRYQKRDQQLATRRNGPRGIFEGSLECAIQNGLKGNCAIQSGRGCMTSFGNSSVLSLFPMPAVEKAARL